MTTAAIHVGRSGMSDGNAGECRTPRAGAGQAAPRRHRRGTARSPYLLHGDRLLLSRWSREHHGRPARETLLAALVAGNRNRRDDGEAARLAAQLHDVSGQTTRAHAMVVAE